MFKLTDNSYREISAHLIRYLMFHSVGLCYRHNLTTLVRSHECKHEGYETVHNGNVSFIPASCFVNVRLFWFFKGDNSLFCIELL